MTDGGPFERDQLVQQPGIIGARWWQASLLETQTNVSRRSAIGMALGAGGAVVGLAAVLALVSRGCSSEPELTVKRENALAMQKKYGWSFGAAQESVTFDGSSTRPFDRSALSRMATDLRTRSARFQAFYVPTLFESPGARPYAVAEGDPENIVPLDQVLMPIFTPSMSRAYMQGQALANLLQEAPKGRAPNLFVIVDLDGPESVAFAAGAIAAFEPIFTFGNWPHPRGVVKAHRTLAAAAYFQPLFAQSFLSQSSLNAPTQGMLVLDRQRLAPYTDDANQFDNRYVPTLPNANTLQVRGVQRVLYVTPRSEDSQEAPDLNETFVGYSSAGIDVKTLGVDIFAPDPTESSSEPDMVSPHGSSPSSTRFWYGGARRSHLWFWRDYPWASGPPPNAVEPSAYRPGRNYTPTASRASSTRASGLSGPGAPGAIVTAELGTMPVMTDVATGRILGAALSRSGSWNRATGYNGG